MMFMLNEYKNNQGLDSVMEENISKPEVTSVTTTSSSPPPEEPIKSMTPTETVSTPTESSSPPNNDVGNDKFL